MMEYTSIETGHYYVSDNNLFWLIILCLVTFSLHVMVVSLGQGVTLKNSLHRFIIFYMVLIRKVFNL